MYNISGELYLLYLGFAAVLGYLTIRYFKKKDKIHIPSRKAGASDPEVLIIGAGIVGSAMAAVLAKDGRRVTVIESNMREPKHFRGEVLQPPGRRALKSLALEHCLEDIDAQKMEGLRFHHLQREVLLPYPEPQYGFHNGRLVMALRKAAELEARVNLIEGTVTELEDEHGTIIGVKYIEKSTGESKVLRAALTVITAGCFTRLNKNVIRGRRSQGSYYMGIVMTGCFPQTPSMFTARFADPGPILMYAIGTGEMRMFAVSNVLPTDVKRHFREVIAPQMPDDLKGHFLEALKSRNIEIGSDSVLNANANATPGVLCIGDALNSRPAVTGSGMTVGLRDLEIVRKLLQEIPDLSDYHAVTKAARKFYSSRKFHHASSLNMMARIFDSTLMPDDDDILLRIRDGAFRYQESSDKINSETVNLAAGYESSPLAVLWFTIRMAFYTMSLCFEGRNWRTILSAVYNAARVFVRIFRTVSKFALEEIDF